jgi:hypothetical protein
MTTKYKQLAQERANELWKFYQTNGEKLTRADIKRISGKAWGDLYVTFEAHQIEAPPVWDSRKERRRRQAELLRNLAKEKGRDWLTVAEVAKALNRQKHKIPSLEVNLRPYGSPKIIGDDQEPEQQYRQEITSGEGLPVLFSYPGPKPGQTTYVIR